MRFLTFSAIAAAFFSPCVATGQITVAGALVQEQTTQPGGEYRGSITLRNDGSQPATVRVYMTDYRFTADGRSEFATAGSSARSNANWITLSSQSLALSPHQSTSLQYAVRVPEQSRDSASGSYWSIIMVEPDVDAVRRRPGAVDIRSVIRQGVQVVTHVGNAAAASVNFSNVGIVRDSTGPSLQFDAANDGARARKLRLSVEFYDEAGKLVVSLSKQRGIVYPGCSLRQLFSLAGLAPGKYSALVVADAGDDDLFAGKFQLTL